VSKELSQYKKKGRESGGPESQLPERMEELENGRELCPRRGSDSRTWRSTTAQLCIKERGERTPL